MMNQRKVEVIQKESFVIFHVEISNLADSEIIQLYDDIVLKGQETDQLFGVAIGVKSVMATPAIRQKATLVEKESQETGRFLGAILYGVNSIVKIVASFAAPHVRFAKNKEGAIKKLVHSFENKLLIK